jgi:hypothetical protein
VVLHSSAAAIEAEIDEAHTMHPFLALPYSDAIFQLLCYVDLEGASERSRLTVVERSITLGQTVSALKYAVRWVGISSTTDAPPRGISRNGLQSASSLLNEARSYLMINAAFSWAHRGLIDLAASGRRLKVSFNVANDDRYEAYDMLIKPNASSSKAAQAPDLSPLERELDRCVARNMIMGAIPTARNVLAAAYDICAATSEEYYQLPGAWQIGDLRLGEFAKVHSAVQGALLAWLVLTDIAHSYDQSYARDLPLKLRRGELNAAVRDVTGLSKSQVMNVIDLLTYSRDNAQTADPALQPVIAIADDDVLLSSRLLLSAAPERNLIALINTRPAARASYDRLKHHKEALMRDRLEAYRPAYCQSWNGRLSPRKELPDIDYALYDASTSTLLIVELKWFVAPDETRELAERSEEIRKGIEQCRTLLAEVNGDPSLLNRFGSVEVVLAVVISANSIGMGHVQDSSVPVITEKHFVAALSSAADLRELVVWLGERRYLPRPGSDYASVQPVVSFFGWKLEWYGFRPLTVDDFMPLPRRGPTLV